jgi:uncharacterized flavoprotein (TIGR03862 family)
MPIVDPPGPRIAIIGGGPAGLMAAEQVAQAGVSVDLFDAMPSVGRKFLLAGKGGLNLTHGEPMAAFVQRYAERCNRIGPLLERFGAEQLRKWADGLGVATFVGSSGRVFPSDLKAAPLLRAWLQRLRASGVRFHMRHRCEGLERSPAGLWQLQTAAPHHSGQAFDAVLLALGGASWPKLGSDGAWVSWLTQLGAQIEPLQPSNCGFDAAHLGPDGAITAGWSEHFRSRFAGQPLKTVALRFEGSDGARFEQRGEFVITEGGVEGSLIYAASAPIRRAIASCGQAVVSLDLLPDRSLADVHAELARPHGSRSLGAHLKARLRIAGVKAGLLRELLPRDVFGNPAALAAALKALPLTLLAARPVNEAISTAGGVRFECLDDALMMRDAPGVFCAGEMLDWEAPTGGYLLTASFASGVVAGQGVLSYLARCAASTSSAVNTIASPCGVRSAA